MKEIVMDEVLAEMHTIQDMLRWAVSCFNAAQIYYGHGTDNPWDEALQLILPSLFLPLDFPADMYSSRLIIKERTVIIERVIRRVQERIPVQYLTNKAWFCGLEFFVDERVFIPRSFIGVLITEHFRSLLPKTPAYILDMCTGSGCIAVASAYAYSEAEVDAVDVSIEVLMITEHNIKEHSVEHRVIPICSDLFRDLPLFSYDLIVTNPPYVDREDMQNLPLEFHFEPVLSLAAGYDGLKIIRRILAAAPDYLSASGVLICEVGNSRIHLMQQYSQVPFRWLEFVNGGESIFMLTREELFDCREIFRQYRY